MNENYLLAELEDKIISLVRDYYDRHISKDENHATILSGGFDSGLLTHLTRPQHVYTITFKESNRYNELRYARAIINSLDYQPEWHIIEIDEKKFRENLDEAIRAMGEPISHFSVVPFYILMKQIALDGNVTQIFSGEGPDEYLGGYARYIIFDELNKLYQIPELLHYHETIDKALGTNLLHAYKDFMNYDNIDDLEGLARKISDYPFLGQIGCMDMELGMIEYMEQKLAKHFNLHLHYPYIDDGLAEYCYRLPDDLKVRNGITKYAFRVICSKFLPKMMLDRAKMGGPVAPVNRWMAWGSESEFSKEKWINYQNRILHKKPTTKK